MEERAMETILRRVSLFSEGSEETISQAASLCVVQKYRAGETVCGRTKDQMLGVVANGCVRVTTVVPNHTVVLRSIEAFGVFGAASLFGHDHPDTTVTAREDSTVLCFDRASMEILLSMSNSLSLSYIAFLSDRVAFLNQKIATFTAGSAAAVLEQYLRSLPSEGGMVMLPPLQRLAAQLGMGRASLYRALEELAARGRIERIAPRTVWIAATDGEPSHDALQDRKSREISAKDNCPNA